MTLRTRLDRCWQRRIQHARRGISDVVMVRMGTALCAYQMVTCCDVAMLRCCDVAMYGDGAVCIPNGDTDLTPI